jgi:hypothetical protein
VPNDLRTSRIWTDDIQYPPSCTRQYPRLPDRFVSFYGSADPQSPSAREHCPQFARFWQSVA